MNKNVILTVIIAMMASASFASQRHYPVNVNEFNVYAKNKIVYQSSDFQGVTGSGNSIDLSFFSILDDSDHLGSYQNPFLYSVITRNFNLRNGNVRLGGVYATDSLKLSFGTINGALRSNYIEISQDGRYKDVYSQPAYYHPNFNSYNSQVNQLSWKYQSYESQAKDAPVKTLTKYGRNLGTYQFFEAHNSDGSLRNVYSIEDINYNMVFDSKGDKREYHVVIVNSRHPRIELRDFKLLGGAEANKILFVFPNANSILITKSGTSSLSGRESGIGVPASILAPNANLFFYEGLVTGSIFTNNLYGRSKESGYVNGGQVNFGRFVCFAYSNCKNPDDKDYD